MLWRYWLYWACLGDVFGSKVKLFLHLVSKKCFDCKGQKSNSLFLKMQVLPVRGTSDLEPFFLVAKWELLLSTGKKNSSWKKNHEEVLRAFEFLFPFTLCLFLCFILWKYFYYTSPSLSFQPSQLPCHHHHCYPILYTWGKCFCEIPTSKWLWVKWLFFALFSVATAFGAEKFGSD